MKNSWLCSLGFWLLTACSVVLTSCATNSVAPKTIAGATPLEWSVRLADSEMARRGDSLAWKEGGKARWDYTAGLFTLSLLKLKQQVPDRRYVAFVTNAIGSFILPNGRIQTYKLDEYQLDAINPGKTILLLWETGLTSESRYKTACDFLREQLYRQPRTPEGGLWHKQRYTNQMWLDGIYMAAPFHAAMGRYFINFAAASTYDEVAKQFRLIDAHTYDAASGLNYHGWDAAKVQPWANPATGCSSNFWGRAMGWYAMALVDTLDYFPTNHPARAELIATLQKTARGLVKWQDAKTGLWWQVMDAGERPGNYLEATAAAMFVYTLAKGVNHGYLPAEFAVAAERGYAGMVKNFLHDDGHGQWSLTQCCSVAGLGFKNAAGHPRDGSFEYYVGEPIVTNDLKGVGPFILAGLEMQSLAASAKKP